MNRETTFSRGKSVSSNQKSAVKMNQPVHVVVELAPFHSSFTQVELAQVY